MAQGPSFLLLAKENFYWAAGRLPIHLRQEMDLASVWAGLLYLSFS
jgi:hypothetical protein